MHKTLSDTISNKRSQQGVALILLVLALLMTGTIFFVSSLVIDRGRTEKENATTQSLARAKEALIAHAASFYERNNAGLYGFLPCPELNTSINSGVEQANCSAEVLTQLGVSHGGHLI